MKLAILSKQTRGHVVNARLTMRYGTLADFMGQQAATMALDRALARGTQKHTFQQLKDEWDRLEAQVGFNSAPGTFDVNIQTTRDNLPAVLALVDEVLRQPSWPQDQFDIGTKEAITRLEDRKQDPQTQAFTTLSRAISVYPKSDPRYVTTIDEQIASLKALRLAEVKKFQPMLGMSHATMAIVGDVDAAATTAWIEKTWGTWKSPRPWKRLERTYTPTAAGEQTLDFPDKANAMVAIAHAVALKDDDADVPAMTVANYTFGGGGFVSRLLTRLRQKDGLSYGAFSALNLAPLDAAGSFFAVGMLNPANAKKGLAALLEELDKIVTGGITSDELAGAKQGLWTGFERNLSNDTVVLGMLNDGLYLDRKMDYWEKLYGSIKAVTLEQVNGAIKKYVTPASLLKITAGDTKKM
jgi:zinc protease